MTGLTRLNRHSDYCQKGDDMIHKFEDFISELSDDVVHVYDPANGKTGVVQGINHAEGKIRIQYRTGTFSDWLDPMAERIQIVSRDNKKGIPFTR